MKILLLLLNNKSQGGMHNYAKILMTGYESIGYDVTLKFFNEITEEKISLNYFLSLKLGLSNKGICPVTNFCASFNLVHITDSSFYAFPLIRKLCQKLKMVKFLYTMHDPEPHIEQVLYRKMKRLVILHSNKSLIKSTRCLDNFQVHVHSLKLIQNFSGISLSRIVVTKHPIRAKAVLYKAKTAGITITFIGRIEFYKGIDILVAAIKRISSAKENVRFIIAGKGILSLVETQNIKIRNYFLSDQEYDQILSETDLLVLPYREGTQSGVLCNALENNIPVIASNVGTFDEYILNNETGFILPSLTVDALVESIEDFIFSPEKIESYSNRIATYKSSFLAPNIAAQIIEEIYG